MAKIYKAPTEKELAVIREANGKLQLELEKKRVAIPNKAKTVVRYAIERYTQGSQQGLFNLVEIYTDAKGKTTQTQLCEGTSLDIIATQMERSAFRRVYS